MTTGQTFSWIAADGLAAGAAFAMEVWPSPLVMQPEACRSSRAVRQLETD